MTEINLDIRNFCKQTLQYKYPVDLQFYGDDPPALQINECMALVHERLIVLEMIASVTKNNPKISDEKIREHIIKKFQEIENKCFLTLLNSTGDQTNSDQDLLNRISDHVSFIILSFAILISDRENYRELRRLEEKFFQLRVAALDDEGLRNVLKIYNGFPKISDCEKQKLKPKLIRFLEDTENFEEIEFFQIPISDAMTKINAQDVYFNHGMAIIPFKMMRQVLCAKFRDYLKRRNSSMDRKFSNKQKFYLQPLKAALDLVCRNFLRIRLMKMKGFQLTAEDVGELAEATFPPCMRIMHQVFRENHHLKHESRQQFTLFIKGIGLPATEAVKLFKTEFTKKMEANLFEKEYRYYIEHAYGLRGSKIDYEPKSCKMIQNTPTMVGDCNGCPLQVAHTADIEDLDKTLSTWKVSDSNKLNIIKESVAGNFGRGCAYYLQELTGCTVDKSIYSPNEFFNDCYCRRRSFQTEVPFEELLPDAQVFNGKNRIVRRRFTRPDKSDQNPLEVKVESNSENLNEVSVEGYIISSPKNSDDDPMEGEVVSNFEKLVKASIENRRLSSPDNLDHNPLEVKVDSNSENLIEDSIEDCILSSSENSDDVPMEGEVVSNFEKLVNASIKNCRLPCPDNLDHNPLEVKVDSNSENLIEDSIEDCILSSSEHSDDDPIEGEVVSNFENSVEASIEGCILSSSDDSDNDSTASFVIPSPENVMISGKISNICRRKKLDVNEKCRWYPSDGSEKSSNEVKPDEIHVSVKLMDLKLPKSPEPLESEKTILRYRCLVVEFDEIVPIENIITGSIIYTPKEARELEEHEYNEEDGDEESN